MYKLLTNLALLITFFWLINAPNYDSASAFVLALAAIFKDELFGFIGKTFISLTPKSKLIKNFDSLSYSFTSEPFINPAILEDLNGLISDQGDEIVSINILKSNRSNRYYGEVNAGYDGEQKIVITYTSEKFNVSYRYLGCSPSGIHILRLDSHYGGSGIFSNIVLVTISKDTFINVDGNNIKKEDRLILKKISSIALGDRYQGHPCYKNLLLHIPACHGMQTIHKRTIRYLIL
ncbi:hypothetical protein [Pseudaeromonas paramecii]|uniref:Uncharacterized protein n=1 Tax=Pseudaeromonas paramecii TaxID=2138166 RepID=A0ABP8Q2Z4_9GAMM